MGDPNAQPPTPKQTPTSAVFPSPVFQTPKTRQGQFDDSGGWTPRFAEDYSVFNSTPGNLRGSQGSFDDFGSITQYQPSSSSGQKRRLSVEGLAADIATHATQFSPNPNLSLPPVDPSRRLPSSPGLLTPSLKSSDAGEESSPAERTSKKPRRSATTTEHPTQTATPPPSVHKGSRKLAPRPDVETMQGDQVFGQPDFGGATTQQPTMGNTFVTSPSEMFGFPSLSGPTSAPVFSDQRAFWDPESSMQGMDIDFSADVFQTPTQGGRPLGSMDWGRSDELFQGTGEMPGSSHGVVPIGREQRSLVPRQLIPAIDTSGVDQALFASTYPTPIDDPFGLVAGAGVNPGLLFTRPPSSDMQAAPFNPLQQAPPAQHPVLLPHAEKPILPKPPAQQPPPLRRAASVKELGTSTGARALASSPIKQSAARPGLSRSFSENRGKKPNSRSALPALAPAAKSHNPIPGNAVAPHGNRPIVSQPGRSSGRISPLKSQHHHRLSSLSSIPESTGPRIRTQAKFTIDPDGRARVETTVVVDDEPSPSPQKRHSVQAIARSREWSAALEDDDSSSDDEPIIIPSRPTSFVLPDPLKPTRPHPFHQSRRSMSERSTASFATFAGISQDEESEAETVMNDATPMGRSGDAASELQKLRESRQRQASASKQGRFMPGLGLDLGFQRRPSSQNDVSPTTLTEGSLPTPSTASRSRGIRCVCNQVGREEDTFMVQWYVFPASLFTTLLSPCLCVG